MKQLTPRQHQALLAVARFWREGRAPTTGELREALHLATESGLSDLLRPLERKGFLSIQGGVRGRQRLIALTAQGRAAARLGWPVLGEIPAGRLREAIQEAGEWLEHPGTPLRAQPADFFLRVQGDSMTGAGILPGDYVLLRPGVEVRSGEIVAAQICEEEGGRVEATLKYLDVLHGGQRVRLRAANPAYTDHEVRADCVTVAGVFRGLVRPSE